MLRVFEKGGEKEMQNINNKLSVEELVHSYDDKISKTDLTIFIGSDRTNKYRIASKHAWASKQTIVYDPERKLKVGEYIGAYYCNTLQELKEIVDYLFNESLLDMSSRRQEDVLDQKDTKRLFYLDDELENYNE